jgi:hypothetical protein
MRLDSSAPAGARPGPVISAVLLAGMISFVRPDAARADGILSEVRLGVLDHDAVFAGGREPGADINGELTFTSPFPADWGATWPDWTRWAAHPRPHIGFDANSAGPRSTTACFAAMRRTARASAPTCCSILGSR